MGVPSDHSHPSHPNNTHGGILHSQLSWGPRPSIQHQLRPGSQHMPNDHTLGPGLSQGQSSMQMFNGGMTGQNLPSHMQVTAQQRQAHSSAPLHNGNGAAGPSGQGQGNASSNIWSAGWDSVPSMSSARDFALNFPGPEGAWSSAQLPQQPMEIPPSGCLVAAAAAAQNGNTEFPHGHRPTSDGNLDMSRPATAAYHSHQQEHVMGHPSNMHPRGVGAPPTPSTNMTHFSPHTPMTPVNNGFNTARPPHSASSVDPAYMGAFLSGGPGAPADVRRASLQGAQTMSMIANLTTPSMDATNMQYGSMNAPPTDAGVNSLGMGAPMNSQPSWSTNLSTQNNGSSGSAMLSSFGPQMHNGIDSNLFAPLGESLTGIPESGGSVVLSSAAAAPHFAVLSSPLDGAPDTSSAALASGGLLTTTQIAGNQLAMTDPFHAVSLELWRQLGYSSSQTYGGMGVDGNRSHGGAMILESDESLTGFAGDPDAGGLEAAISLSNNADAVNGLGIDSSGALVLSNSASRTEKMPSAANGTVFAFHPQGRAGADFSGSTNALEGGKDDDDEPEEELLDDDDMLASDEEADEDESADPSVKAARLSAKKLRLHRRQGVTCDQCRSKHLRCDLSDRKFRAFEASLQRSLGRSASNDPGSQARQEAALAVQAEDEAKLDTAAAAKAAASGTPVVLNNPIRCTRCEKRGLVCTKSYNPPSKRHPRPSRTGKRIEQARQLHGSRPIGEGGATPLTTREVALGDVLNMLAGEVDLSTSQSTDARLYNRILASSINVRLLTTYFTVFHIQMPVIDFDNFCFRFNHANGDMRKMAIMANGGDDEEGLPSAIPEHRNLIPSESTDPRDSTISTPGTVEALIAAMHLCAALYTDMPLIQPVNSKKLFRTLAPSRLMRALPSRAAAPDSADSTVNSFILPHPKGSKEDQITEQVIENAAAEAAGKPSNKRLKRKQGVACDSCRLRRVRCDLTERPKGASCTRCEDKKINCTAEYIESIRAKGKTVVLDVVHAKAEAQQKNRARDRETTKERFAAAAAAAAAAGDEATGASGGSAAQSSDVAAVAAAAAAVAAVASKEEDEEEEGVDYDDSDGEVALERAQERWVRSSAARPEFGRLQIADEPRESSQARALEGSSSADRADGGEGSMQPPQSTSRDVDMGAWGRVSPDVPDTVSLVDAKDMLQWGRARQGFFKKLKERAVELVYRHDLLHRPSAEAVQTLMILCHVLYAVDPVQVKLFASVALKHIKVLNLQTNHEVYEQDQEAVEHLLTDMQASRVYLTSWTRDGIMAGMYRTEPNFPEERTIQVKGGQRPMDPSDQLASTSINGQVQGQQSGTKELSGQMGLTFSIMAMTQIGALSRFVAKHIDRTEGVPAGASATDRFPLLPTPGDMKKLTRACNAVWQGTDALLQFFDKCAARSREDMNRLKPFQPLPWIAMLKMCGAMLDLAVYRVLSERYGVNAAYMAAITRQIQMSNGTAVNPKIRPLSPEDFEQAKLLRALFEKGRNRAMNRSRRTAHLASFLLRKKVFQFGGVIMRQFFAVSQFLARMPCEDARMAALHGNHRSSAITTLDNTPQQSTRGIASPEDSTKPSGSSAMSPAATVASTSNDAGPSSATVGASTSGPSNLLQMQARAMSPSATSTLSRTESSFSGRTMGSAESEGHVPWYVGARELGPFDAAAKKREVGWCLEAMMQIGYAWPDMELKISSVEAIMRAEGLFP
ncbi:hypothetical protein V8E36_002455 [Tilletia maclaganii]